MGRYAFNTLGLLYALLEDQSAFVTTQPPADIANRLPALVIEASAPIMVTNRSTPGAAAEVAFTLTALSEEDTLAFELCDSAYSSIWDSLQKVTRWGWITHLEETKAPFLMDSPQAADDVYQYMCALEAIIRK